MRAERPRAAAGRARLRYLVCAGAFSLTLTAPAHSADSPAPSALETSGGSVGLVTVSASRLDTPELSTTASEGLVAAQELQLAPTYRPGQLLETVPGLIVTLHSGEGKANQFLMRGYNLDHGTDLAVFVDGMPINQPTHAHGQGYTDLNFLIPELTDALSYTKGPYHAALGDFGALGSVRLEYRDTIADQISAGVGSYDFQRLLAAGSRAFAGGQLLGAAEAQRYDGPSTTPDDARKENAVVRYSAADGTRSYSLTAMYYHQLWTNTTDIPLRAIAGELGGDRFGTLDPSDGGRAERASLSGQFQDNCGAGRLAASAYLVYNQLHLYNDFTHYLIDPLHADQEDQFENRHVAGAAAQCSLPAQLGSLASELAVGGSARYDSLTVGRLPSQNRLPLAPHTDPAAFSSSDRIYLFSGALYAQATTHWTTRLRSVLGLRDDYQHGSDVDYLAALHAAAGFGNGGTVRQSLWQPKASLIFTATPALELYASAGRGFHSADLRGVNQDHASTLATVHTPLLASQTGAELGMRVHAAADLAWTLALYHLYQQSETTYNPDTGTDVAGPPSRRVGFELSATWQPRSWLELYGSVSGNHARFTRAYDDGTGHLGTYIPDAPAVTGELAAYLVSLGRWSGGLAYRYLGGYPLSSGACANAAASRDFPGAAGCAGAPTLPGQVNASGFGQLNLDVQYRNASGWTLALGAYNLLNTHAAAAQFWYVDRLPGEIRAYPQGRADAHEHPLEPFMVRLTLTKRFGS